MTGRLRTCGDLCEWLGLRPSAAQQAVIARFEAGEDPLEVRGAPAERLIGSVGIVVLTRLLVMDGSRAVVIAPEPAQAGPLMQFLYHTTTNIDPQLRSVCDWPSWDRLRIGHTAGHECILMPNRAEWARNLSAETTTLVVLDAGATESDFALTRWYLEGHFSRENVRAIRVW